MPEQAAHIGRLLEVAIASYGRLGDGMRWMISTLLGYLYFAFSAALLGCGSQAPAERRTEPVSESLSPPKYDDVKHGERALPGRFDIGKTATPEVRILFVGNSHTTFHDLPTLVCKMIAFRHPEKKVNSQAVFVAHLDQTARDPRAKNQV